MRRLVDEHADRLYGLFRLVLADRAQAEDALGETFEAALSEWDSRPRSEARVGAWLIALSAGALQRRLLSAGFPRTDIQPSTPIPAELLADVPDATLAVMVRALPGRRRRAVALGCVLGIPVENVAVMLDCQISDITGDVRAGIGELTERLRPELKVDGPPVTFRGTLARKPAPHLAPIPKVPTGPVKIRNGRVYRERTDVGFMEKILRAISRTIRRIRKRGLGPLDDTAGTSGLRTSAPEPTPTMRPIQRPRETPTIARRDRPEATPGMASYRMPGGTPSTQRISNPSHPGQAATGRGLGAAGRPRGY